MDASVGMSDCGEDPSGRANAPDAHTSSSSSPTHESSSSSADGSSRSHGPRLHRQKKQADLPLNLALAAGFFCQLQRGRFLFPDDHLSLLDSTSSAVLQGPPLPRNVKLSSSLPEEVRNSWVRKAKSENDF